MIIAVFLGGLVLLFLLGFGAPYAIGLVSLVVLIMTRGIGNIPLDMVATKLAFSANNFTLLAIPFFLLAGKLMNTGSITTRIFRFCWRRPRVLLRIMLVRIFRHPYVHTRRKNTFVFLHYHVPPTDMTISCKQFPNVV